MKKYLFSLLIIAALAACKKGDTGPAGVAGNAGPAGPQGVAGNANVTQYTYGSQNLVAGFTTLQVTTTLDSMNKCAWFVYLYYQSLDRWYFVPGYGTGGATQYRLSMGYASGKVNIYIDKIGPGEIYSQAKIIRVYSNTTIAGGRHTEPVAGPDYTNYEEVRKYYELP